MVEIMVHQERRRGGRRERELLGSVVLPARCSEEHDLANVIADLEGLVEALRFAAVERRKLVFEVRKGEGIRSRSLLA